MFWPWAGFIGFVLLLLGLDLGVFHRRPHAVGMKEALAWSAGWIGLSLGFNVLVYWSYRRHWFGLNLPGTEPDGWAAAVMFFTGYVLEKSLSVDNVFVMALIFGYFRVPAARQHRVLFWGILGALILRGMMILAGAALISRFDWILYVFGGFLVFTSVRLARAEESPDPGKNPAVRLVGKIFPVTPDYHRGQFAVRSGGRWLLTPLGLALVAVEATDVVFAVDSIPAVFAVTTDSFLVFTSNVFAILGLRSLYFALAGVMDKFRYLKASLAVLLALIGLKMLLKDWLQAVPGLAYYTLALVAIVLAAGAVASLMHARRKGAPSEVPVPQALKPHSS